jgi:protein-arginine kinase activator protein McsA
MKCQSCDNQATLHVTELVNGEPIGFHVCEAHFDDLDKLKAAMERQSPNSLMAFLGNPGIREAMGDPEARKKVAPICSRLFAWPSWIQNQRLRSLLYII